MDLSQQVKNHEATVRQSKPTKALPGKASKDVTIHHQGLQRLSNGEAVPYSETLRIVQHEGSRAPRVMSATTRKPPGYIRNESGGMFTS